MKNIKLGKLWDSLHSSYWFVPSLMVIARIANYTHNDKDRDVLRCHAQMISRHCLEQVSEERDRNSIKQAYEAAIKALNPNINI
jgi:uncharacterized membrane protein